MKISYDLTAAIANNSIDVPANFEVLAEILSEVRGEGEYFWLIRSQNNYFVINGSCDYTGWDCQSSANISNAFDSINQLQLFVPEFDNQNRPVREMILNQLKENV